MANHSVLISETVISPKEIEQNVAAINNLHFKNKMLLTRSEKLTRDWGANMAWILEAPNTAHYNRSWRCDCNRCLDNNVTSENLGFVFWLQNNNKIIEIRHVVLNFWIRWVQDLFRHELAERLKINQFDGGDGLICTNTKQFNSSYYEYISSELKQPLNHNDEYYLYKHHIQYVPDGWDDKCDKLRDEVQSDQAYMREYGFARPRKM
jgi:hypothetical protein